MYLTWKKEFITEQKSLWKSVGLFLALCRMKNVKEKNSVGNLVIEICPSSLCSLDEILVAGVKTICTSHSLM